MISICHSLGRLLPRLLAALVVCLTPAALSADTVIFRNDCRAAVTVQSAMVVKSTLKRDQYTLRSTESTPKLKLDSDRVIQITDPRTGRVLVKEVIRASKKPLGYSIAVDRTGKVRLIAVPVAASMMKKP